MITRKAWHILIVDDDRDVHAVTQLALKNERIDGLPFVFHHAHSAAEALEMIGDRPHMAGLFFAAAIVDVVMETEDAGLRLCRHIRERLSDHMTQLILRTGQPGAAPERRVVEDFNISAYLSKGEATPERLYVSLRTAVRNFAYTGGAIYLGIRFQDVRARATSADDFFRLLQRYIDKQYEDEPDLQLNAAWDLGGRYLGCGYFRDQAVYEAMKASLLEQGRDQLRHGRVRQVPNPVAQVGEYVIVQTRVLRSNATATLVLKNPTIPRDLISIAAIWWREQLSYLAELGAE